MKYSCPAVSYLKAEKSWIAFAQTGDFFITFTNQQGSCCDSGDCGPPENVPIPARVIVDNGVITLVLTDPVSNNSCSFDGNISDNGSFIIVIDSQSGNNCNFDDEGPCSDIGQEPNQCCDNAGTVTVTGTYKDGHLEASYVNQEDVDEADPDCSGSNQTDCRETGDLTGDFS